MYRPRPPRERKTVGWLKGNCDRAEGREARREQVTRRLLGPAPFAGGRGAWCRRPAGRGFLTAPPADPERGEFQVADREAGLARGTRDSP